MSHVGDVADVTYFVAYVRQVAVEYVECYGRAGVAEMAVAVDGGAADVHAHSFGVQRFECFFLSCERVVDTELTHWESGVRNEELGAGRVGPPGSGGLGLVYALPPSMKGLGMPPAGFMPALGARGLISPNVCS